eukprot:3937790-Rhodomonas_salina.9
MGVRSTYEKVQYRENVRQSGGGDSVGVMGYDSSRLASFLLRVEPVPARLHPNPTSSACFGWDCNP